MRWAAVVLVSCATAGPPPATLPSDPPRIVMVHVREYGSNRPVEGATIAVEEARTCPAEEYACTLPAPERRAMLTDAHGDARLALTGAMWTVTEISKPGYATSCPIYSAIAERHLLFQDDENDKTCLLVPRSAFVVSDSDAAIRRARELPEVAAWLRDHPDARAGSTTTPPELQVHFTVDSLGHGLDTTVIVDALDGSAFVQRQ